MVYVEAGAYVEYLRGLTLWLLLVQYSMSMRIKHYTFASVDSKQLFSLDKVEINDEILSTDATTYDEHHSVYPTVGTSTKRQKLPYHITIAGGAFRTRYNSGKVCDPNASDCLSASCWH